MVIRRGSPRRHCLLIAREVSYTRQGRKVRTVRLNNANDYVEIQIGFPLDEWTRIKDTKEAWVKKSYPLVDQKIRNDQIVQWYKDNGIPVPKKSRCPICPYQTDRLWIDTYHNEPAEWATVVKVDQDLRNGRIVLPGQTGGDLYLHRSKKPLGEIIPLMAQQGELFDDGGFNNECSGFCGT